MKQSFAATNVTYFAVYQCNFTIPNWKRAN